VAGLGGRLVQPQISTELNAARAALRSLGAFDDVQLVPRHGASSGCGWRRRPPDMEGSCEYID
jgi:hypothetical protein